MFPPCARDWNSAIPIILSTLLPAVFYNIQAKALLVLGHVGHITSPLPYRIGIDTVSNIHHGGLLAALQFLGGIRISICLNPALNGFEGDTKILVFNCILSILGWLIISSLAAIGYIRICFKCRQFAWMLVPILWSLLVFLCIMQQSFAAHLQGYSFVYNFVFSLGLVYSVYRLFQKHRISMSLSYLFSLPLFIGITISGVRVSGFWELLS